MFNNDSANNDNEENTYIGREFSESKLAADYRNNGYAPHYNKIDAEAIEQINCEKCGYAMQYIGLKKDKEGFLRSYVAIGYCNNCGNDYEF
ncbi:MAG: hypothetical protein KatS3mg035_1009 [Bacteroidia bacterium]|nr:MAG: hypothetical protein KatS3mg035_1009 [Bacteroidia bacterium]